VGCCGHHVPYFHHFHLHHHHHPHQLPRLPIFFALIVAYDFGVNGKGQGFSPIGQKRVMWKVFWKLDYPSPLGKLPHKPRGMGEIPNKP